MTLPLLAALALASAVTLALALYRMVIVRLKGDECLHVLDTGAAMIEQQRTSARRLESLDVWGKALTVLTLVLGIATYVAWWLGA